MRKWCDCSFCRDARRDLLTTILARLIWVAIILGVAYAVTLPMQLVGKPMGRALATRHSIFTADVGR